MVEGVAGRCRASLLRFFISFYKKCVIQDNMNKLWDWNLVIDVSEDIRAVSKGCEHCGQNPCVCGSRTEDPHKNLEELAQKIIPLVEEINQELERHAKVCKKMWGDDEAGYPPNCNDGYEEKDGKCVPIKKEKAKVKKTYADLWNELNKN